MAEYGEVYTEQTGAVVTYTFKLKDGVSPDAELSFTSQHDINGNYTIDMDTSAQALLETTIPDVTVKFSDLIPEEESTTVPTTTTTAPTTEVPTTVTTTTTTTTRNNKSVEVEAQTEVEGNKFIVTYYLNENEGINSTNITVKFDKAKLKILNVINGKIFSTGSEWLSPTSDQIGIANINGEFAYTAVRSEETNTLKTGKMFQIVFGLADGVASVDTTISTIITGNSFTDIEN